jgi:hypothetical protein
LKIPLCDFAQSLALGALWSARKIILAKNQSSKFRKERFLEMEAVKLEARSGGRGLLISGEGLII